MANEVFFKQVTGTGAAISVNCGFIPATVHVVNITAAGKESLTWHRGMADASAIKSTNAGRSVITTLGITPVGDQPDTETGELGFIIGADAAVNIATNIMLVKAERGGDSNQF